MKQIFEKLRCISAKLVLGLPLTDEEYRLWQVYGK